MQINTIPDGILISDISFFDLEQTLDCGQCFRFSRTADGSWHGVAGHRSITLRQTESSLTLYQISIKEFDDFWRNYFDFDRDYAAIRKRYLTDPVLSECARFAPGIHILRQDAWETLISFIISQNNNVPRIKGIIDRLCTEFGERHGNDYDFPKPDVLATLDEQALSPLRCGWRAAYILDAAHRVSSGEIDLNSIATMPIDQARKELQIIHGVGPKVAECVLLYGMARTEAFPLDVWMKRAMTVMFPGYTPQSFGKYAGIAQQYIFHYCRCHPDCCC